MMVLDLDRRGYHREAAECLDAWLHYQGTVGLPGDFDSKEGVLLRHRRLRIRRISNQHHGWVLWTLSEHYRFTRDDAWLRRVAPGIVAGADWIIRETARTASHRDLSSGTLARTATSKISAIGVRGYPPVVIPGADSTGARLGAGANSPIPTLPGSAPPPRIPITRPSLTISWPLPTRSPVVCLRDGTAVPQIPSYVQRRGPQFRLDSRNA